MTIERRILLFGCLAGALGALAFGFALDWDLLNYHLYNPHALLHGRHAIDLAPAQQQTFLNPLLHLPVYLLFRYVHSGAVVVLTGAIQGSQLLLLYLLLAELVDRDRFRTWMLLAVAALGLGGPIFLSQLGGSQGDTLLSLPVLAALLVVVRELKRADGRATFRAGLVSGLLLGIAAALKLTMAVYAMGLPLAALVLLPGARRWKITAGHAAGGLLGVALAGGPWFAWLWSAWDSPLFPYFNELFRSPWVGEMSLRDLRFMPRAPLEWLFYPFFWSFDPLRVWEFRFRDLRVPLLFTMAVLVPLLLARRGRERAPGVALVWLFLIPSYLLWLKLFSIYRYSAVIEMLAPILIFATVVSMRPSRRVAIGVFAVLLVSQLLVKFDRKPSTWLFQADRETVLTELPEDAMIVVDGYEPVGYAALWLDDAIPIIRIRANFMPTDEPGHRFHALAHERVRAHPGPHYLLLPREDEDAPFVDGDLARVGLRLGDRSACQPLFRLDELQRLMGLRLCALAADAEQAAPAGRESSAPAGN